MFVKQNKQTIGVLILAILTLLVQIYFWNIYFKKLSQHSSPIGQPENNNLTVLICAKNEEENLKELLPHLFEQKLQSNILIVDDFSEDNSTAFLDASANRSSLLKYINSSSDIPGKKLALIDGLKNIKDGLILLTDADCRPASAHWSKLMSSALGEKEIVLGFSPYKKSSGFLNRWIRYEAILTAIQYLSFALNGRPYMGVGRNVLYKKTLVNNGEVLEKSIDLASGDDDLLINSLATKSNTTIQIDPNSWTFSSPKSSWSEYFKQKRRHVSTASSYKFIDQIMLLLFSISWISFYLCIAILFCKTYWWAALALLIFRWISTYFAITPLFSKLNGSDCISHWWYLDLFTAFYFLIFSIFAIIPQRNKWQHVIGINKNVLSGNKRATAKSASAIW